MVLFDMEPGGGVKLTLWLLNVEKLAIFFMELTYIAIAFLNESWRLKCPEGPTRKVNTSAKLEVKFFI